MLTTEAVGELTGVIHFVFFFRVQKPFDVATLRFIDLFILWSPRHFRRVGRRCHKYYVDKGHKKPNHPIGWKAVNQ